MRISALLTGHPEPWTTDDTSGWHCWPLAGRNHDHDIKFSTASGWILPACVWWNPGQHCRPSVYALPGHLLLFSNSKNRKPVSIPISICSLLYAPARRIHEPRKPQWWRKSSRELGLGILALSIPVCLFLFYLLFVISRRNQYNSRLQLITLGLTILFSSILILADQFLRVRILK